MYVKGVNVSACGHENTLYAQIYNNSSEVCTRMFPSKIGGVEEDDGIQRFTFFWRR